MLLDAVVVLFAGLYVWRGWRRGLIVEVVDLAGLVVAIVVSWVAWPYVGAVLAFLLPITDAWARALGGIVTFGGLLTGLHFVRRWVEQQATTLPIGGKRADGAGGTLFAGTWSVLLATALLLLAVTVPSSRAGIARPLCDSTVSRFLVSERNPLHGAGERLADLGRPVLLWVNQRISEVFTLDHDALLCDERSIDTDEAAHRAFRFPPATETEIATDEEAEAAVLDLLNQTRVEAGLEPLEFDAALREVGRAHSRDMYLRGYFAHETPECARGMDAEGCTTPFDRMDAAGIRYRTAGENLALAPTPQAAHRGLMDSPGHRANILHPDFTRAGIGVIRGPYGLMVTQQFTG